MDDFENNFLFNIYSIPNIFWPFIAGVLADFYGVKTMIFINSLLVTLGAFITWLGTA